MVAKAEPSSTISTQELNFVDQRIECKDSLIDVQLSSIFYTNSGESLKKEHKTSIVKSTTDWVRELEWCGVGCPSDNLLSSDSGTKSLNVWGDFYDFGMSNIVRLRFTAIL